MIKPFEGAIRLLRNRSHALNLEGKIGEYEDCRAAIAFLEAGQKVNRTNIEHAIPHSQWGWCPGCQEASKEIRALLAALPKGGG